MITEHKPVSREETARYVRDSGGACLRDGKRNPEYSDALSHLNDIAVSAEQKVKVSTARQHRGEKKSIMGLYICATVQQLYVAEALHNGPIVNGT